MKYKLALIIVIGIVSLTGCSNKKANISEEQYELALDNIETPLGINQMEAYDIFYEFTKSILSPDSEDEMHKAVENVSDYFTVEEIELLKNEVVYTDIKANLTTMNLCYIKDTLVADSKEVIEATVEYEDYSQDYVIELYINTDGKIYQHKIWKNN